jgi:hypothetical protein
MTTVNAKAPAGQESVTSALCWSDAEAASRWIAGLESVLDDVLAASVDQLLPLRERQLGHVAAARITHEGGVALRHALEYAKRGLLPPRADVP